MNNRETFEAWMKKEMPHETLKIISDTGVYLGSYAQILWVGWQVALASQAQQPTDLSKQLREYAADSGYSHNDYADTMLAAAYEIERCAARLAASQAQQEPVGILNHSDIALLKQWFNAVQDLNPKYLNEGGFQLLAKLQSQAQQEPVRPWICPNFMLPPRSEEVLVYPMPNNVAHTAFHDGECWRVTEYENNYGYSLVALPDGVIKGWMPIPPAPEGDKP